MTVDCETRTVELTLYVQLPFKDIPGSWQDRVHYQWSDDYCADPAWATSITRRWKIVLTIRWIASEQHGPIVTDLNLSFLILPSSSFAFDPLEHRSSRPAPSRRASCCAS